MSKEYRKVVEHQHNKWSPKYYDCELWIDGKFIQVCTFSEVTYRSNVLMEKLKSLVDKETFEEIKDVMELKYDEGAECAGSDL